MERDKIPGTIMLWPGVAEELLGGKAYLCATACSTDVDAVLFTHVGDNLATAWGQPRGTGLVSVEYTFQGESAHSAGAPWRGHAARSMRVELMNIGWDYPPRAPAAGAALALRDHRRRRPAQRRAVGRIASGTTSASRTSRTSARTSRSATRSRKRAAMMTDTTVTRQVIGTAAPRHFNKPIAEAAYANIQQVGLPKWTDDEQALRQGRAEDSSRARRKASPAN